MCLAPGLVAFSAVNIFARAFFAIGDTRTPMRISVLCLALNLVLVVILIGPYQQAGMGIANSISSTLNAFLLFAALKRKRSDIKPDANTKNRVLTGLCVLLAAGAAWKIWEWCDAWRENPVGKTSWSSQRAVLKLKHHRAVQCHSLAGVKSRPASAWPWWAPSTTPRVHADARDASRVLLLLTSTGHAWL